MGAALAFVRFTSLRILSDGFYVEAKLGYHAHDGRWKDKHVDVFPSLPMTPNPLSVLVVDENRARAEMIGEALRQSGCVS